ncbi:MAG: hypothetical protein HY242_10420 [Afipia sp.]|nr:hypothetical protein [Afipia sp.]
MSGNEFSRRRMQKRRLETKNQEAICFQAAQLRVKYTVSKIKEVLADSVFRKKLAGEGVKTIPVLFAAEANSALSNANTPKRELDDVALEFAAAWAFFYPLLSNRAIVDYLQATWPEFVVELRDAFILLVLNGPFPQECCGIGRPARKPFPLERVRLLQAETKISHIDK